MKSRIIKDYLAYLWLSFFHCSCDKLACGCRMTVKKDKRKGKERKELILQMVGVSVRMGGWTRWCADADGCKEVKVKGKRKKKTY